MYAVRLGSYSIAATRAGTPSLRRLKSTIRYRRLAPPPRCRAVLRPLTLRPPDFLRPSVSDFSGFVFVISAKSGKVRKRRPGDVGLGLRTGIQIGLQALEDRDRIARADLHDGLLPLAGAARGVAPALRLGGDGGRADVEHLDLEQRLDGLLDLRLVRVLVHAERVLVGRRQHVGLLGDDGPDDHLAGLHQVVASLRSRFVARAVSASIAAWEATSVPGLTMSATPAFSASR